MLRYVINLFLPGRKNLSINANLRAMHTINKISILMFLAGIAWLVIRQMR